MNLIHEIVKGKKSVLILLSQLKVQKFWKRGMMATSKHEKCIKVEVQYYVEFKIMTGGLETHSSYRKETTVHACNS